ncbi:hypothetical protein GIB67_009105 [Kingdonia uniflora]|uniref:ENTH domain-containing protein n=1 Tax=Kingdonia uniflora TaxID=39325 RepID=A0A7J7N3Q6_9MAGN|nr:hypothetical protein GIB67_009105 [Kingdonia uniflora]
MKKAFGQTVRDLKRGVNKNVLKVPGIEQKVLDATSNEPWGPHGSLLADIAQATRNYHEYQMIMSVLWKRINDTGKNWRHVYKALTVLEYLVAHGSERVIDEIKEHVYQISTLSDFQYIDSGGRDQGGNVRKKSQSLVVLVNDKEKILEARQKALTNREKFRNSSSPGGMYKPNSNSSPGRYGDRYDEDRNGYGREKDREWGPRDDERYGKGGDSYSRDGDRYSRDSDDRYRDTYKDDDYRGRSRSIDDYQYGSRSRSSDGYKERGIDDDDRYSTRSSGAKAEDHSQDERRLERKFSEQNIGAPPSYEEAVTDTRSPVQDARGEETTVSPLPKASSPSERTDQAPTTIGLATTAPSEKPEFESFDEFDPRGSFSAAPSTTNNGEMDLLGSLSDSFSSNPLAIMPVDSAYTTSEADAAINSGPTFVSSPPAPTVFNQPAENPFGDSPFKAFPTTDIAPAQQQPNFASSGNFQPFTVSQSSEPAAPKMDTLSSFDFGDTFAGITYTPSNYDNVQGPSTSPQFLSAEPQVDYQNTDVLANIFPQSGPTAPMPSQTTFPALTGPPPQGNFQMSSYPSQVAPQMAFQTPTMPPVRQNSDVLGNLLPQTGAADQTTSQGISTKPQQQKAKFEPKSSVWSDTLSRGLVNFNISGPKTNPLADIGVDFDSINRKERRERPVPATAVSSTITMGKAMGSGSGIGRAGASVIPAPSNPMIGSGMGMGGGVGNGMGMGMGGSAPPMGMVGYGGGMNQQPMGIGMGMGQQGMNMGMGQQGMNIGMGQQGMHMGMGQQGMHVGMGMGQGVQMRPPMGMPPTAPMSGGYNLTMGPNGYQSQQPYGGYR